MAYDHIITNIMSWSYPCCFISDYLQTYVSNTNDTFCFNIEKIEINFLIPTDNHIDFLETTKFSNKSSHLNCLIKF